MEHDMEKRIFVLLEIQERFQPIVPDCAVAYLLALIDKQASELRKRDKLLVKSDDLHFRSHVALPVLPSAGMTLHDAQVFHSARHQGIEVLAYIFQELKRRIEQ